MTQKIAFFLPHFGHGGAEGVVLRVLAGLDRNRFAPHLILQRRRGELLDKLPADVPVSTLTSPRPPACIPALAQYCTGNDVALLVTVTNAANLYALAAAALPGHSFATLVMEHTPPATFLAEAKRPWLRRTAMRALYPHATLTGGPLDEIGADIEALLGRRAPPFRCLPNPVVDRIAPLRPVAQVAQNIVSVGRLASEKRFNLLIDAFAQIHRARPDTTLTIYGDGAERPVLEAQIDTAGLSDVITLPGYISDMDIAHARSDLFVCTSRREGLGNAIIEAMARGVPVLSVDCPFGPRRLLRDGAAGHLVADDDAANVSRQILQVLADAPLRERYADAAMEAVGAYDIMAAVNAYQDAFDIALAKHASTSR